MRLDILFERAVLFAELGRSSAPTRPFAKLAASRMSTVYTTGTLDQPNLTRFLEMGVEGTATLMEPSPYL